MPTQWVVRNGKRRRKIDALGLAALIDLYAANRPLIVYSEKVGAMPGQGVTSMFSFGRAVGVVEGEFGAAGVVPEEVTPQTWQKALGLNSKGDKSKHRKLAAKLYPAIAHMFARQKDDGRADAALILSYGRQQEQK